eukprot:NODE_996_length_1179_cov_345.918584_g756_i0.p1 GENE.NODE_996_length_1179_cov_345.918584_g756_i0~~NODE_996_length_1179_cov_345.918584_g756_i0.p1  ORF type:complete len:347 (-),score=70.67 NODE_996_length_1179_cov_345.918584_g756_i0:137-1126(-)
MEVQSSKEDLEAMGETTPLIQTENSQESCRAGINITLWCTLTGIMHILWGALPAFAKSLQDEYGVHALVLQAGSYFTLLLVMIPITLFYAKTEIFPFMKFKLAWVYGLLTAARNLTLTIGAAYTCAYLVQLVTLMSPFLTAVMATLWLEEKLTKTTVLTMVAGLVGGAIVIIVGVSDHELGVNDAIGLAFATLSTLSVAFIFVVAKMCIHIPPYSLVCIQCAVGLVVLAPISLIVEWPGWAIWGSLSGWGWIVFLIYSIGIGLFGSLLLIFCVHKMGSSFTTSILALRLLSALLFGWILNGDEVKNAWQWVGIVIVLVAVTACLVLQRK